MGLKSRGTSAILSQLEFSETLNGSSHAGHPQFCLNSSFLRAVLVDGRRSGRSHRNSTDQKIHVLFVLIENKVEQGRTIVICAHGQTDTSHIIFTCPEATRMRQSATVTGKGFNCQDSNSLGVEVAKSGLFRACVVCCCHCLGCFD